jgi:hypothetical protein
MKATQDHALAEAGRSGKMRTPVKIKGKRQDSQDMKEALDTSME